MEQGDSQPTSISISASSSTWPQQQQAAKRVITSASESGGGGGGGILGRNRYKFWALAGILILAFWSMFTGSVTLKWSAPHLTSFSSPENFAVHQDLDILEVEEREKMVRHMWEVYTQSHVRLPRFWQEAFEAAYEHLTSDVPSVTNAAVSEIAHMSFRNNVDLLDYHNPKLPTNAVEIGRGGDQHGQEQN